MDKGDFNSWEEAVKFYKEEYKDLNLEEFMDRMMMKWEEGEFEDVQAFSREVEDGIKLYSNRPKKNSVGRGGRPVGRRNESTIKKYNYIRNKYHIVKKKQLAHTIEEYARLIRSEMLEKKPEIFEGGFYSLSTIIDIIKKQKWGD